MNLMQIFRRQRTAPVARERLQVLLAHERMAGGHSELLAVLREEILAVLAKHIKVDHDKVNIKLSDATANELARRPIEYDTGFTLLPGKYTIKFLARDDETGRIGTYQGTFVIPNLNKEEKRVPTSSVVLSSQRVELKDALYNAAKTKDQDKLCTDCTN